MTGPGVTARATAGTAIHATFRARRHNMSGMAARPYRRQQLQQPSED